MRRLLEVSQAVAAKGVLQLLPWVARPEEELPWLLLAALRAPILARACVARAELPLVVEAQKVLHQGRPRPSVRLADVEPHAAAQPPPKREQSGGRLVAGEAQLVPPPLPL